MKGDADSARAAKQIREWHAWVDKSFEKVKQVVNSNSERQQEDQVGEGGQGTEAEKDGGLKDSVMTEKTEKVEQEREVVVKPNALDLFKM